MYFKVLEDVTFNGVGYKAGQVLNVADPEVVLKVQRELRTRVEIVDKPLTAEESDAVVKASAKAVRAEAKAVRDEAKAKAQAEADKAAAKVARAEARTAKAEAKADAEAAEETAKAPFQNDYGWGEQDQT